MPTPFAADDPASQFSIRPGVTYLNHGSFGPAPRPVIEAREAWFRRLESEPMDFFFRQYYDLLSDAAAKLGRFVGCRREDLVFVDNATVGMNVVAASIKLSPGDE